MGHTVSDITQGLIAFSHPFVSAAGKAGFAAACSVWLNNVLLLASYQSPSQPSWTEAGGFTASVWPTEVQLHTKLYGSKEEELEKTAIFILQSSYTPNSTAAARRRNGEDGHIHLADWTLDVTAIEKMKNCFSERIIGWTNSLLINTEYVRILK